MNTSTPTAQLPSIPWPDSQCCTSHHCEKGKDSGKVAHKSSPSPCSKGNNQPVSHCVISERSMCECTELTALNSDCQEGLRERNLHQGEIQRRKKEADSVLYPIEEKGTGCSSNRDHTYTDWGFVGLLAGYLPILPAQVSFHGWSTCCHYYPYPRVKGPPMPSTLHCP